MNIAVRVYPGSDGWELQASLVPAASRRVSLLQRRLLLATLRLANALAGPPGSPPVDSPQARGLRMFLRECSIGALKARLRLACYVA